MAGPVISNRPNVFTENLPAPMKALVEMAFPPDSLGIEPGAGVLPIGPVLGAIGKKAPKGILERLGGGLGRGSPTGSGISVLDDVPVPQGLPSPQDALDLIGQLRGNLGGIPTSPGKRAGMGLSEAPMASGHGFPDYVPVGGEAAFNALRTPKLMPSSGQMGQIQGLLSALKNEVGHEGIRKLQRAPIPTRKVQAPPRLGKPRE